MSYKEFLESKQLIAHPQGKGIDPDDLHPALFDFQRNLTRWSVLKGRAAIFAGTGMGKTIMFLSWSQAIADRVLVLSPLAVAQQTVREGIKFDIPVTYARSMSDSPKHGITVTNYEMMDHFDEDAYEAVVLDESSIIKDQMAKTRTKLIDKFKHTPYKLACTATPAPNDILEIANHAEFLGIMNLRDVQGAFFTHDSSQTVSVGGWRLRHYGEDKFYRWLASWAMTLRMPSDLGYDDNGFVLPPLNTYTHFVDVDYVPEGQLYSTGLKGIQDRQRVRRATIADRVNLSADLINDSDEQWVAWVGLDDEGRELEKLVNDCILVEGRHSLDYKTEAIESFLRGDVKVMITKRKIAGFGLNMQNCHNAVYVGLSDSFEKYYQSVRRFWRFGQDKEVNIHVVMSDIEDVVWQNVQRKETEANRLMEKLIDNIAEFEKAEIGNQANTTFAYQSKINEGRGWRAILGDSSELMKGVDDNSIDLTITSWPFLSLYTYSDTERDLGNCESDKQFFDHMDFITPELMRVMKPGRNVCIHCQQVPLRKVYDGVIGIKDFRGDIIRHMVKHGFIYHGEVTIDVSPQAAAIRSRAKGLAFQQFDKDSSWMRSAFASYILVFRVPGENEVPIKPAENGELTRDDWIRLAHPVWYGIKETETLNTAEARTEKDERHIAPLQLETIENCLKLYSNPGETILDYFGGIGSVGYEALKARREALMMELKPEYFEVMCKNLKVAESLNMDMFEYFGVEV
jgi:DNA modification methylase